MPGRAAVLALIWALGGSAATTVSAGMIDESGLKPWENCALCHSLDGISRMAKFPKLAGQVPAYIEKQIRDFRSGSRANDGGQMRAMADLIQDKDLPAVAAYFGGLPPPPPHAPTDLGGAGARIAKTGNPAAGVPACLSCHGKTNTAESGAPRLEAQHRDYLIKQLSDFKSGERRNDPAGVMADISAKLTKEQIDNVGAYFSAQARE